MEGGADRREARRPMNSFFIFCKRHRSMVRERHPEMDNRSISRILGDLWTNLGKEEKQQYTATAKQYKDAFLKANPDYKWHSYDKTSLLWTSTSSYNSNYTYSQVLTAKSEVTSKNYEKGCLPCYNGCSTNSNNMDLLLMAIQQNTTIKKGNTTLQHNGKKGLVPLPPNAADMSALLSQNQKVHWLPKIKIEPETENMGYPLSHGWNCKDKDVSRHPSEPSEYVSSEYAIKESPPSTASPPHVGKDGNESDDSKSHRSDASLDVDWAKAAGMEAFQHAEYALREVSIPTRKSKRRNKGAIYKNLIASGALPASRERLAEMQTIYNVASDDGGEVIEYRTHEQPIRRINRTISESDSQFDKRYKTGDFDLEAKIATLPACSMDSLRRSRKNSGKQQKLSNESSRRPIMSHSTPTLKTDMLLAPPRRRRHPVYPPIVGSRKRKQPRDGIMRILPLSKEYRHPLASIMKIPLTTFYVHPSMKSYQELQLNRKPIELITSPESEGKDDDCIIEEMEIEMELVAEAESEQVLTGDDTTSYVVGHPATSAIEEDEVVIVECTHQPPVSSDHTITTVRADVVAAAATAIATTTQTTPVASVLTTVSSSSISMDRAPSSMSSIITALSNNTAITTPATATTIPTASNIQDTGAAVAAYIDTSSLTADGLMKQTTPSSVELGQSSTNLHVTGELKVQVGNQSPKRSKLGENPDFKIWISNLAEAAERAEQIPVC